MRGLSCLSSVRTHIAAAFVRNLEENDCLLGDETDPGKYLKMHLGTLDFKILDQFSALLENMVKDPQICEGDKYHTTGAALTAHRHRGSPWPAILI